MLRQFLRYCFSGYDAIKFCKSFDSLKKTRGLADGNGLLSRVGVGALKFSTKLIKHQRDNVA